ncbi:hydrolase [Agarivorans gilvus]|nr:hydrolase [Agarivorans gilvus]
MAGKHALQLEFEGVNVAEQFSRWPNAKFHPAVQAWDWSAYQSLSIDLTNPDMQAATVILKLADKLGVKGSPPNQLNYQFRIPAQRTQQLTLEFDGGTKQRPGYWGGTQLDLSSILELQIFVQGPIKEQQVILDNLRLNKASSEQSVVDTKTIIRKIPTLKNLTSSSQGHSNLVSYERSEGTIITELTNGMEGLLDIRFSANTDYPNVTFKEAYPWDWSEYQELSLAFDIDNQQNQDLQLFVRVDDAEDQRWGGSADGVNNSLSAMVTLPANSSGSYYLPLKQLNQQINAGMTGLPPKPNYLAEAIKYGWGQRQLDLSNIVSFQLYLQQPKQDAHLQLKRLRLIPDLDSEQQGFAQIVDKFGQYTGYDWPKKVHSDEELRTMGHVAKLSLKSSSAMPQRSKFGGWLEGPKSKASGHFRTAKLGDKWSLVDPLGYPFFATGLSNIRLDDSYTLTGYDSSDQTKSMLSPVRASMFTWLPERGERLADGFSYAEKLHSGAQQQGEIFSFYAANLQRKYGGSLEQALNSWQQVTLSRMQDWGFTSLGNWTDPAFYNNGSIAYVAHGEITGEHARIATPNDYWGAMHDPFDPVFRQSARAMAQGLSGQINRNDPWLIGIFVDNELSWGNQQSDAKHFGLVAAVLAKDQRNSAAKTAFTDYIKSKYWTIEDLNQSWQTTLTSWVQFERGFDYHSELHQAMRRDYSELLYLFAEKYYAIVRAELKKELPNHLYLGSRFADWGHTEEVLHAASLYVDVLSFNHYSDDFSSSGPWAQLAELDKPAMVSEFHFGATDMGMFAGGVVSAKDQEQRAAKYSHYMRGVVAHPNFVGAQWFQYIDAPLTGRAWDGENYNNGFVSVSDSPYPQLVEAAKKFNQQLYQSRFK